jgi:translation initiation factor 4G
MSSIPPKSGLQQPQGQSTSNQAASSPSTAAAPSPAATKSYANATKKSATDSTAAPVTVGGSSQHGKSTSVSPVSGKPMQQPQTPGVTIVNGAPAPASSQGDHSRKPSVTITSAGTSGYIPNGGPSSRPNSLQFGFAANQPASPNMGNPAALANQPQSGLGVNPNMNPRVTSPQTSPSPIPQPASSGGRPPPSSYQAQVNVPNFGSFGDAGDNVSAYSSYSLSLLFVIFPLPPFCTLPFTCAINFAQRRKTKHKNTLCKLSLKNRLIYFLFLFFIFFGLLFFLAYLETFGIINKSSH